MPSERVMRRTPSKLFEEPETVGWEIGTGDLEVTDTVLGRGKFGEVRLGEWWGTKVAVKSLYNFDLEENKELFHQEIKIMKDLHHPHIVQFFGFCGRGAAPLILMEWMPHGSVEDYLLKRGSRVGLAVRVRWASQMAQALAYLHNRKPDYLIHRDLKPSNFMLTPSLQCKVGDFGISRLFEALSAAPKPSTGTSPSPPAPSPRLGSLRKKMKAVNLSLMLDSSFELDQTSNVGTARYMAPEVFNRGDGANARYGAKADVFSVGMVLYFVFEGEAPRVPGGGKPELHFAALAQGNRPPFHKTKVEYQRIIDLCLKDRPSERPSSAELVNLLKPLVLKTARRGGGLWGCAGSSSGADPARLETATLAAKATFAQVDSRLGQLASFDGGAPAKFTHISSTL